MIGRNRRRHAAKIASRGLTPSRRSTSKATSIIMIAFFFTMPIKSRTPITAMTLSSFPNAISANAAPTPADASVERIVTG